MIKAKKNQTDYFEMLSEIIAPLILIQSLQWFNTTPIATPKAYCIRHDIDDRFVDNVVKFAKEEGKHGVRATYFMNHDRPYFNYSAQFEYALHEIVGAGHIIGLHNNAMAVSLRTGEDFDKIVGKALTFLRKADPVFGTSAHGDPLCAERNFHNYDIWCECRNIRKGNLEELGFTERCLSDFGLSYEAYNLPHTFYLSDNGGNWSGGIRSAYKDGSMGEWRWLGKQGSIPDFERIGKEGEVTIRDEIINQFNQARTGFLQILIHPQHWEVIQ